ncbi:MAG: hypothetical protein ACLUUO_15415 [Sellimonas intestinalis]
MAKGYKVAICEQMEDPTTGKGDCQTGSGPDCNARDEPGYAGFGRDKNNYHDVHCLYCRPVSAFPLRISQPAIIL